MGEFPHNKLDNIFLKLTDGIFCTRNSNSREEIVISPQDFAHFIIINSRFLLKAACMPGIPCDELLTVEQSVDSLL